MNFTRHKIIVIVLIGIFIQSCVPAKEFQALQDRNIKCEEERERYFTENETLEKKNKELVSELRIRKDELEQLLAD
ncbi:MAG TPA: hypothetical protein DG754_11655, partial [Bacteroidales bacterium]|nr:hypothetical protein [Bacteroidales bacterium]